MTSPLYDEGIRRAIAIGEALADVAWEARTCPDCEGTRVVGRRLPCREPGCVRPCKHPRTTVAEECRSCDSDGNADCCVTCGTAEARCRLTRGPHAGKCGDCMESPEGAPSRLA